MSTPDDPSRTINDRPIAVLEFQNESALTVDSREVWLMVERFYTKSEVLRAGDRKVMDCGKMARADLDPPQTIAPRARAIVRMSLEGACVHNREHEHFFVTVQYLGSSISSASWKREPSEFSRLLAAAQPHP